MWESGFVVKRTAQDHHCHGRVGRVEEPSSNGPYWNKISHWVRSELQLLDTQPQGAHSKLKFTLNGLFTQSYSLTKSNYWACTFVFVTTKLQCTYNVHDVHNQRRGNRVKKFSSWIFKWIKNCLTCATKKRLLNAHGAAYLNHAQCLSLII